MWQIIGAIQSKKGLSNAIIHEFVGSTRTLDVFWVNAVWKPNKNYRFTYFFLDISSSMK